ncbi:MAG: metallophosphoesterase family protein [Chloroflexi bacterium]|nr:metallophosphoesterase family protein [Chloroflexota bacterium]
MRYAVIADIHGNLEAFQAVLSHAEQNGSPDAVLCLGDVVGYGPDPSACVRLMQDLRGVCVAGNHDLAVAGTVSTGVFNVDAAVAIRWTASQLSDFEIRYLGGLQLTIAIDRFTLVHGSPRDPVWEYLSSPGQASENLAMFTTPHCLVGHTHVPVVFRCGQDATCAKVSYDESSLMLGTDRVVINPGSIGQPRDGDPRASYAILDVERGVARNFRVEYDVALTQGKMLKAGLPDRLIRRLSFGR